MIPKGLAVSRLENDSLWHDLTSYSRSGKEVIFVVVDRLSKAAYFMALNHPYTSLEVAPIFMDNVFKLHGMPKIIVSDRDVVFTSKFLKELFKLQKVFLLTSAD